MVGLGLVQELRRVLNNTNPKRERGRMSLDSRPRSRFGLVWFLDEFLPPINGSPHHRGLGGKNLKVRVVEQRVLVDAHHLVVDVDRISIEPRGGEPIFGDLRLQAFHALVPVLIHVLRQHFVERHVQTLIARRVDVRDILREHLVPQRRNIDELCQEIELGRCDGHIDFIGCAETPS